MVEPKKETPETKNEKKDAKPEGKKKVEKEVELSEEDKQLQDELNLCVERLTESDAKLYKAALDTMSNLIKAATTSMTSVPKPLKFLRPHYDTMKGIYEKITDPATKTACADVLSVQGMTVTDTNRECLKYKLLGGGGDIDLWGHEYVRHLTGEVAAEWQELTAEDGEKKKALLALARLIVPYLMSHNTEAEACDLLMEIEHMDFLLEFVDLNVYQRVCLYLTSCVPFVPDPENTNLLKTCLAINRKFNKHAESLRLAIQLNDIELITEIFKTCPDKMVQKQMAYMLGRQQIFLELDEDMTDYDELTELMSNSHLNTNFLALARELDIMEPKVPEDIFKSHLEPSRLGNTNVDSARANLSSSFVNGFVNCGFGQDKLLMEDGNKWLYKNKEHGMMSATATLGMILLWDVDGGLTQIDKYLYSNEDWIKAGALLACGIVNSGVRNECDPALALLSDYTSHQTNVIRIGSIVGLGLAYAGSNREDVLSLLLPVLGDSKASMEVVGMAALACGMVSVGSCNEDVTSTILQTLMEKSEADLKSTYARFLALGLALTYLGKQEAAEAILAALQVISEPIKSMAEILVDVCAYAGTGNVLKIQNLLHICSEHYEEKDEDNNDKSDKKNTSSTTADKKSTATAAASEEKMDTDAADGEKKDGEKEGKKINSKLIAHQGIAVLGIALIAMGEEIGSEMCFRSFGHLLRYGEVVIKRAVPLALALLSTSNPKLQILDTLSKFSHDSDSEVSANSILAMGIVGAGTNNARLAAMLRQLAMYHSKDPSNLFMVRLAQGLTHLGKGTMTLSPFHSDRSIMHPVAVAGLLAALTACLDVKNLILGKAHYILFNLVTAIQPRMLTTFDEELRPLPVTVRVGQAVDVVGQAGKPKTITGFQTHTTPVLLAHGERAELATEEYLTLTPILEGFVILKKNPDYEQ